MIKLAPNVAIDTPAGSIWMPDWVAPWHAPTIEEKQSLYDHMEVIELPPSAWNEWRREVNAERVSDIRSYLHLFTIWLRVARWQVSCRVPLVPGCVWGQSILEQARGMARNVEKPKIVPLTPAPVSLFS